MRLVGGGTHGGRVGEEAVGVDADQVRARQRQRPRPRARREHERPVRHLLAALEDDDVRGRVDPLHGRLEAQLDDLVLVLLGGAHVRPRALDLAAEEALRQRRPVVWGVLFVREDRDRGLAPGRAVLGRDARGREAAAHDDDGVGVGCHEMISTRSCRFLTSGERDAQTGGSGASGIVWKPFRRISPHSRRPRRRS